MDAPQDNGATDATPPQGQPQPFLDASYNPRDIKTGPVSGQDAAVLWGDEPPADDDSGQEVSGGPAASTASTPAGSDGGENGDSTAGSAAYDAAARQVKTLNSQTCAQAALMLNAQDGGEPVPDQVVADYYHVPLSIVADNREQFRYPYNRNASWRALSRCSVLPGLVVANPQAAPAVNHDLLSWSTLEGLLSESGHVLNEGAGAIVEPIAHLATALAAKPISDISGLAATAYEAAGDEDHSQSIDGFARSVRDDWTYQPRTELGASPVNPLNSIPTWFGMLLNFALPNKAEDGDTAGGMFRNGVREAIPQALGIAGAKVSLVPKALREGNGSGVEVEGQTAPNPDPSPAADDVPQTDSIHPVQRLAPSVQADLAQSVRTASTIDRVSQLLKGNRLCQENPALCSKAVQEMASQGDMHTLYVPQEAFEYVARGHGTTSESLLQRMPEAQASGALLAIPAHEYFIGLPEGMAQELSMFAKTDPAGSSLAETLAQAKENSPGAGEQPGAESAEGNNRPPVDVSGKTVRDSADELNLFNRKKTANYKKMIGHPDAADPDSANREAYAAEHCAARDDVESVYVGKEADKLINGNTPGRQQEKSTDVVGVTANGRYHVYEAGGADISGKKIDQLTHTMDQLGKEKVLSMTLVMKEKINTPNFSVEDNVLFENGRPKVINKKKIFVLFTTQGK